MSRERRHKSTLTRLRSCRCISRNLFSLFQKLRHSSANMKYTTIISLVAFGSLVDAGWIVRRYHLTQVYSLTLPRIRSVAGRRSPLLSREQLSKSAALCHDSNPSLKQSQTSRPETTKATAALPISMQDVAGIIWQASTTSTRSMASRTQLHISRPSRCPMELETQQQLLVVLAVPLAMGIRLVQVLVQVSTTPPSALLFRHARSLQLRRTTAA